MWIDRNDISILVACLLILFPKFSKQEQETDCIKGIQYWSKSFLNEEGTCAPCPLHWKNCYDQPINDHKRCEDSCREKKTTTRPAIKTKVQELATKKQSTIKPTTTPSPPEIQSTTKIFKTTLEKTIKQNKTTPSQRVKTGTANSAERSGNTSSSSDSVHLGLAVGLGILGTFVVCLLGGLVVYMWRCSRAPSSAETSNEEERIEMCAEPSTSSQESSPVIKRLHSEKASRIEDKEGIILPLPETEKDYLDLVLPAQEQNHTTSTLHVGENEN